MIFKNPFFSFKGVNLSSSVRALAFEQGAEPQDKTAGGNDDRVNAAGLNTWALEVEFNWAAGSTNSVDTLFGSTAGREGAIVFRPTTAAISAANPQRSGTAVRSAYSLGGAIGDQHVASVSLVAGSDLAYATT